MRDLLTGRSNIFFAWTTNWLFSTLSVSDCLVRVNQFLSPGKLPLPSKVPAPKPPDPAIIIIATPLVSYRKINVYLDR